MKALRSFVRKHLQIIISKWLLTKQVVKFYLGEPRLLRGNIAPPLDNGLANLPWVGPGPGADLLGHIHTLLGGLQLGHQLGHVLAGPLGLQGALLLGGVLHHRLHLVPAGGGG